MCFKKLFKKNSNKIELLNQINKYVDVAYSNNSFKIANELEKLEHEVDNSNLNKSQINQINELLNQFTGNLKDSSIDVIDYKASKIRDILNGKQVENNDLDKARDLNVNTKSQQDERIANCNEKLRIIQKEIDKKRDKISDLEEEKRTTPGLSRSEVHEICNHIRLLNNDVDNLLKDKNDWNRRLDRALRDREIVDTQIRRLDISQDAKTSGEVAKTVIGQENLVDTESVLANEQLADDMYSKVSGEYDKLVSNQDKHINRSADDVYDDDELEYQQYLLQFSDNNENEVNNTSKTNKDKLKK